MSLSDLVCVSAFLTGTLLLKTYYVAWFLTTPSKPNAYASTQAQRYYWLGFSQLVLLVMFAFMLSKGSVGDIYEASVEWRGTAGPFGWLVYLCTMFMFASPVMTLLTYVRIRHTATPMNQRSRRSRTINPI